MTLDIRDFNQSLDPGDREICDRLSETIERELPDADAKIWHGHPVWFLKDNPTVGYSVQKRGVRLMFWSGVDFDEPALSTKGGKFKDASIFYKTADEVRLTDLERWLSKSRVIAWDYKNLVRRKGRLERLP